MALNNKNPQVMGILNITPDSLYPQSCYPQQVDAAVAAALQMVADGASIIDIGGESTRPGSAPVALSEELARVIPVITALRQVSAIDISVDTSQPEVMHAAVAAGATIINDVRALQLPGALEAGASLQVPVCLMHMQGTPQTMQNQPNYVQVTHEVHEFLRKRIEICLLAGIMLENLIIDPGFGFGKTSAQNFTLLQQLDKLQDLGCPILVGLSRKASIGEILNVPVTERLYGSLALTALAVAHGARIIRTHDVKATHDVVRMVDAVMRLNVEG